MKRRLLATIMCLVMVFSLGFGVRAEEVELTEPGTYPISEEPLEMTMFRVAMPNVIDFETNDFTKYIEDLTNIKRTFKTANNDNADM